MVAVLDCSQTLGGALHWAMACPIATVESTRESSINFLLAGV
jgi:hypothetical protein